MTNPTVVTNLTGGQLALLVRLDEYTKYISSYIYDRVKTQRVYGIANKVHDYISESCYSREW